MVFVTFRNSNDKLSSMFGCGFATVDEAKDAILRDASIFKISHSNGKNRQSSRWVDPKFLDYYEVKAKDGTSCIWQYWNRCG